MSRSSDYGDMPAHAPDSEARAAHLEEFKQVHAELVQRIILQNAAAQRLLTLTASAAGLAVSLYGFVLGTAERNPDRFQSVTANLFWLLLVVAAAFSVISQLLLANWIYQTWIVFVKGAHISYLSLRLSVDRQEPVLVSFHPSPEGTLAAIKSGFAVFGVMQAAVAYVTSLLGPVSLFALGFVALHQQRGTVGGVAFSFAIITLLTLLGFGVLHLKAHLMHWSQKKAMAHGGLALQNDRAAGRIGKAVASRLVAEIRQLIARTSLPPQRVRTESESMPDPVARDRPRRSDTVRMTARQH